MKRIFFIIMTLAGTVMVFFAFLLSGYFYMSEMCIQNIDTVSSPDFRYEAEFEEIGSPWLFGPADVRITVADRGDKRRIGRIYTRFDNEGIGIKPDRWKVQWTESEAVITLHERFENERHIVPLDGSGENKGSYWETVTNGGYMYRFILIDVISGAVLMTGVLGLVRSKERNKGF